MLRSNRVLDKLSISFSCLNTNGASLDFSEHHLRKPHPTEMLADRPVRPAATVYHTMKLLSNADLIPSHYADLLSNSSSIPNMASLINSLSIITLRPLDWATWFSDAVAFVTSSRYDSGFLLVALGGTKSSIVGTNSVSKQKRKEEPSENNIKRSHEQKTDTNLRSCGPVGKAHTQTPNPAGLY